MKRMIIIFSAFLWLLTGFLYGQDLGENDMKFYWYPREDSTVAGYQVTWGNDVHNQIFTIDAGLDTFCILEEALPHRRIFFRVTPYDSNSAKSPKFQQFSITNWPGDKNKDGRVDIEDMIAFDKAFAKTIGHPEYDMYFDEADSLGLIDFEDMIIFDSSFGNTY